MYYRFGVTQCKPALQIILIYYMINLNSISNYPEQTEGLGPVMSQQRTHFEYCANSNKRMLER